VRRLPPFVTNTYAGVSPTQMAVALAGGTPVDPVREVEQKPEGELEITKGEKVIFKHSGNVLGHVEDVVYDDNEIVGVVIRPSGFFTHLVLIQIRFIDRSDDLVLFTHITEQQIKALRPYTAEGGGA
jgi:sporulation protein YlmC with PRC-barrel domain